MHGFPWQIAGFIVIRPGMTIPVSWDEPGLFAANGPEQQIGFGV